MPMVSIWNLRPLSREPETKEFRDSEQPEWHMTLTLIPPDGVRATRYATLKQELIRKHITGLIGPDGELVKGPDKKPLQEPEPVRCGDFSKRTPDEFVIDRYAKLVAMWAGEDEPPPLSEAVGWQVLLYEGWFDVANWIEEVFQRGPDTAGNSPGDATDGSSEASSNNTESIQSEPNETTLSNAHQNGHSGQPLGECGQLSGSSQESVSAPVPS